MTRLIVTSDRNGKSGVGLDRPIPSASFASVPGFDPALIWGTAATPSVPWDGRNVADERKSVLPESGETRLMMVTFPPDSVMMSSDFDPASAARNTCRDCRGSRNGSSRTVRGCIPPTPWITAS